MKQIHCSSLYYILKFKVFDKRNRERGSSLIKVSSTMAKETMCFNISKFKIDYIIILERFKCMTCVTISHKA